MATFTLASAVLTFGMWPADPSGVEQTALTLSPVETAARQRADRTPLVVAPPASTSGVAGPGAAASGAEAANGGRQGGAGDPSGGEPSSPSAGGADNQPRGAVPVVKTPLPPSAAGRGGPLSGLGGTLDDTTSALGSTLRSVTSGLGSGIAPLSRALGSVVVQAGDGLASTVEKLGAALAALLGHGSAR